MGTGLPKTQSCRLGRAGGRVTIRMLPPRFALCVCQESWLWSGWGLLLVSSHSVWSPWLWGRSLSSSQPRITLHSKTGAESAALPHSHSTFVIFWKHSKSPLYMHSYPGRYFENHLILKEFSSSWWCSIFSILKLLTCVCARTCALRCCCCWWSPVKIHGKQFPKYRLAVYGLFRFFEGIYIFCRVRHSWTTGVFMAFLQV